MGGNISTLRLHIPKQFFFLILCCFLNKRDQLSLPSVNGFQCSVLLFEGLYSNSSRVGPLVQWLSNSILGISLVPQKLKNSEKNL